MLCVVIMIIDCNHGDCVVSVMCCSNVPSVDQVVRY